MNLNRKLLDQAPHLNAAKFQAALEYTARTSGFRGELIEKDYYCSLILTYLFAEETPLIFKGGTCLNKVHVGFYRLSEDLDFSIDIESHATRGDRRKAAEPVKRQFAAIHKIIPALTLIETLSGHNEGRQYTATITYQSAIAPTPGIVKFEVGLREPILDKGFQSKARTLLLDPFKKEDMLGAISVACLSAKEAYAEKIRAALTRKDPAIRDIFDIDYAVSNQRIDLTDANLLSYVQHKIDIPKNSDIDVSPEKIAAMRAQMTTELRPVLRQIDYDAFDFERAVLSLAEIANALRKVV
jgi:predicted nucleotidyltransferase component of viral defense system